jgi:hypothetical protein
MTHEFILTPRMANILKGRKMRLICSAPKCLFATGETNDLLFEREIKVKGYGICSRCGHKTPLEMFEYSDQKAVELAHKHEYRAKSKLTIPKCEVCGGRTRVVYTQKVIARHHKKSHFYYHKECWENMYFHGETGELFKRQKYRMRYAGTHGHGCVIFLPFDPRKGVCMACGKSREKGEIKTTSLHHWKYAYKADTIRKNPILILENTTELCFACHMIADSFRNMLKLSDDRIMNVYKTMPKEMQERFKFLCGKIIRKRFKW